MIFKQNYKTPDGFDDIVLHSDGTFLTGLLFKNSKEDKNVEAEETDLPIFNETRKWLDEYFVGQIPNSIPKYKIENLTPFRKKVIKILEKIGYGELVTYNDIAKEIAAQENIKKMSAQAVGGAVRANPICIIVPCHRVIGSNGKLIGYGGGINNKEKLLELEKKNSQKNWELFFYKSNPFSAIILFDSFSYSSFFYNAKFII